MKTIVITGSTSGIGKALTEYFAKTCRVFAGYRNEDYVKNLENLGVIPFYIDMKKPETIRQAAAFIKSKTDKVDTLINVAGCVVAGVVEKLEVERIKEQFEVNTFSHLDLSQRLLDITDKIINISSMASFGIFPFIAPYCASKRAMDILFNSLLNETKRDIKIVSVKPGVIATPLWEKSLSLNKSSIDNCKGFEKEMNYMVKNARKNQRHGLDVSKVVDLIAKIDEDKNPKPSYTIGLDAKIAQIISLLPQQWINKIVKYKLSISLQR